MSSFGVILQKQALQRQLNSFESCFYITTPKINLNSDFFVMLMNESFVSYFKLAIYYFFLLVLLPCYCYDVKLLHEKFNLSLALLPFEFLHLPMMNLIQSDKV
jgi:hypothetical protein